MGQYIQLPDGSYAQHSSNWLYNGTTYESQRNNTQGTLLASAARTATTSSPYQTNYNARGVFIYLNITAASGTGGLVVQVYTNDTTSGNVMQMNVNPTAITAIGKNILVIYPGATTTGNTVTQTINLPLPRSWFVNISHGDATSYTYSVGYALIL